MRTFELHDGEDEGKTLELHKFLEGFEWEGDGGGITIYLDCRQGSSIQINDDGSILIRKKQ